MWCGADLSAVPVPESERACPVCETGPLRREEREGWVCHVCDRCGGLWMEWAVLERLEQKFQSVAPNSAPSSDKLPPVKNPIEDQPLYRQCPQCLRQMARRRYQHVSRVVVDTCIGHGVWFDRNEFEHVLVFLESGGLARSRAYRSERERETSEEMKRIAKILRDACSPPP